MERISCRKTQFVQYKRELTIYPCKTIKVQSGYEADIEDGPGVIQKKKVQFVHIFYWTYVPFEDGYEGDAEDASEYSPLFHQKYTFKKYIKNCLSYK